MSTLSVLVADIARRWQAAGIAARRTSLRSLDTFARQHSVQIPPDLREFLLEVGGMDEHDVDEHGIRFWPLEEFKPVHEELPELDPSEYAGYFVFADYSMWSHGYAIRLEGPNATVSVVGGPSPIQIAESFGDFLESYVRSPTRLFP